MSDLVSRAVGLAAAFVGGFAVGYLTVTKVAPAVQAKVEAMNAGDPWDVWDDEEWLDGWTPS